MAADNTTPKEPERALTDTLSRREPGGSVERRFLAGDNDALGQVRRWIAEVLTGARFWFLRPEWSDLHQEILLRVVTSLRQDRFDSSKDFRVYVQAIARYTALTAVAAGARQAAHRPRAMSRVPHDDPHEAALIDRQLVRRVLDSATPECRRLFQDYFLAGLSYAEVAARSSIPEGTVKSRLFRCLRRARRTIAALRARDSRRSASKDR